MRKKLFLILIGLALVGVVGFLVIRAMLPKIVAEVIISDDEIPGYVPGKLRNKIKNIRTPLNENAEVVITAMHKSGVTIDEVLKAMDNVKEEQVYAMMDELNKTGLKNLDLDQVFDMAKRHFPVEFDVEVFRKPFHEKVNMKLIKKGLLYANRHRRDGDIEPEAARSIAKRILIQKEKKFNEIMKVKD